MPRYTLLRLIGLFYRLLAFLAFLTTTGATFYSAVNCFQSMPLTFNPLERAWSLVTTCFPVFIIGFVLMTTFYAFAQIIDLLVTLAANMRMMIDQSTSTNANRARLPGVASRVP